MAQIITYLGIIDSKNNPIVLHNFEETKNDELNFQINTYCALDIMETKINKQHRDNNQQIPCFIGLLNSTYLSDEEYDIYGYQTSTNIKLVLIMKQRSNMQNYEDSFINHLFQELYKVYQADLFNPFNSYDLKAYKPSQAFYKNLNNKVKKIQTDLTTK